jgi:ATP-dependent helicase/nuclease subunit A
MVRDGTLMAAPADDAERRAVVRERERTVVVDAGAGTGKTTLVVDRLVEMIAPEDNAAHAVPLGRLAAVTFTRKAAGELRLRVRERILRALATPGLSTVRRTRLHDAIGTLDHAHIGTIHSFADRLLRMYPVAARLSPTYEIVEDAGPLEAETFELLMTSIDRGTLASELAGTKAEGRAAEATDIVLAAVEGGLRMESRETPYNIQYGLDALVAGLLEHRDVPPRDVEAGAFDRDAFLRSAEEFQVWARQVRGVGRGARWFSRSATLLRDMRDEPDVAKLYKRVVTVVDQAGRDFNKRDDFEGDDDAYSAWKAFNGDAGKTPARASPLRDDLMAPLRAWMARRLVRLAPVVEVLYEKVKARHRVVDTIDLLLRLRDLLAGRKDVRAELQATFDHIFVDEFQDTDPLQAEVMLFLAEDGAHADEAWGAKLRSGSITIVGDPKQSIYRFRRADIATYDRVRRKLAETSPLQATLRVNFRSTTGLIGWLNDRFGRVFPPAREGSRFDAATGEVFHAPLEAAAAATPLHPHDVDVIPLPQPDANADVVRADEAGALARYVRWLVAESGTEVTDPIAGERRALRYGDVAVLAVITTNLPLLCRAFDAQRVPYATSGGTLFLQDALHQQFILGLRALADREDGVAEAALFRPPFFAIDLADLAIARGHQDEQAESAGAKASVERVHAARELVAELRKRRATRSPGATARDLLEKTALGRTVALEANGSQRLRHLRELCAELDVLAVAQGLDYDGATYVMRGWVDAPPGLDPARPIDDAAVRVTTVHQAKGLEFPVVILWDARCLWDTRDFVPAWAVDRETRSWAMKLDPRLQWDEPSAAAFAGREKMYRDAERRRLIYVAATRAREKFVMAVAAGGRGGPHVNTSLAERAGDPATEARIAHFAAYDPDAEFWPPRAKRRPSESAPQTAAEPAALLDDRIARQWSEALGVASRPRFRRAAASSFAKESSARALAGAAQGVEEPDDEEAPTNINKPRPGRFGSVFGETVHRAIGLVLTRRAVPADAVARAARETGLGEHRDEAIEDVNRTIAVLGRENLLGGACRLEYPVAIDEEGADGAGYLLVGSIDWVRVDGDQLDVLDFKTDRAPSNAERVEDTHPAYVAQVRTYADILARCGLSDRRSVRCGLLFTETGRIHWVPAVGRA